MDTIALLISAAVLLWAIFIYNRLVRDRNRVRAAWSDIEVQLKRRHDLLPKLVEAVRQYAGYEQATLASVAERVAEIGILKATGWRDWDVSRLLTAESLYAGLIGGLIGTVVGVALAFLYGRVAAPALPPSLVSYPECADTPAPAALPISALPQPALVAGAIVVALLIGCLSGYLASRRASKLHPAEALRQL